VKHKDLIAVPNHMRRFLLHTFIPFFLYLLSSVIEIHNLLRKILCDFRLVFEKEEQWEIRASYLQPAGSVDTGGDFKGDILRCDPAERSVIQRFDPLALIPAASHSLQSTFYDRPILPDQRSDVGNRSNGCKVHKLHPIIIIIDLGEHMAGDLPRKAGTGQFFEGIRLAFHP